MNDDNKNPVYVCTECGDDFSEGYSGWDARYVDPADPVCESCDSRWCGVCHVYRSYGEDGYPNCGCN